MRRTWIAVLPLFVVFAPTVNAGGKTEDAPTVVVRVKSLDALLQNLNLVVRLVGQEDAAQQIEGLIKSKIGKNGLEGIDPDRPFGAYVRYGKNIDDVAGAILVPILDEKTFLTLLDNLGVAYVKDRDGIYTHKAKNVDVYFRFANKYLYITALNTASIQAKTLPDPAKTLAGAGESAIAVVARVDQVPKDTKDMAQGQFDKFIDAAKKKSAPGETKVQEEFRLAVLNDFHKFGTSVIAEAKEVRFDLDVNPKTKELAVSFNVVGKPGSDLAKSIKSLGDLKSPLAAIGKQDAAFQGAVHFALPDPLKKAFANVIDEVRTNALKSIQDDAKKAQAKALLDAMTPTAQAGEFQAVAAIVGPKDKHYTFLGAVKLKDGDKLGKTVRDLIADALQGLPEAEKAKFKLDADTVGGVAIHRFEVPKDPNFDKFIADVAGDN